MTPFRSRWLPRLAPLPLLLLASSALAQSYMYPVPWPKAGGGMLVAVPLADAKVSVYRMVGAPHLTAFNVPFNTALPELVLPSAPRDTPILLWAPVLSSPTMADEDDIFLLVSDQRLVVSMADDERQQQGSPDRIFFMPADNGTFLGRVFYGGANGGDPNERLRITNLGSVVSNAVIYAWQGSAWAQVGTTSVQPGTDGTYDPPIAQAPYKVVTSEDSMVVVGYMTDNATMPAADLSTGLPVGGDLYGYGSAWHLRAVSGLSYTVETRAPGTTNWTQVATGSLAPDEGVGGQLSPASNDAYLRLTLTGGVGWAIVGTPSLLAATEWNGYFLPTQDSTYCTVGRRFFTNSSARTVTMLPHPGTTVTSYDADSGVVTDRYTSTGAWEFHNAFHNAPARVEITNGIGSVLLVGTLNWGGCDETSNPGNCGILEGGYSLPGLAALHCGSDFGSSACQLSAIASCTPASHGSDGGAADAGAQDAGTTGNLPDAGEAPDDGGTQAQPDAGPPGDGTGAGASPPDAGSSGHVVSGAGCCNHSSSAAGLQAGAMGMVLLGLRRRRSR